MALSTGNFLAQLGARDVRHLMKRADWSLSKRSGPLSSITLHYNGPQVNVASYKTELAQLVADSYWHTRPGAFGVVAGGDGIMYHLAVTREGHILQLRDLDVTLWHCANNGANRNSLAVHLPLGGSQAPSAAQWLRTTELFEVAIRYFGLAGRQVVKGHIEWPRSDGKPQSACPGPIVMGMLKHWRNATTAVNPTAMVYCVKKGIDFAAIRTAPTRSAPQALGGKAEIAPGTRDILVDALVPDDQKKSGPKVWAHLANGLGFVHLSLLEVQI